MKPIPDFLDLLRLKRNIKFYYTKTKKYVQIQVNQNETRTYFNMFESKDELDWMLVRQYMYLRDVKIYLEEIFANNATFGKIKRKTSYKHKNKK
jgi:hypothetical protein